jgi:basic amino acid/polyamine antiporter, APA family
MAFVRSIGRWTMIALVINCIIGSGIFGLPSELTRLLGRASPFAMIFAALTMAVIMACIAEVASQFSEPGGAYLYARTAFGRFCGMQIGWFELLSVTGGLAAVASIFLDYFAPFLPWSLSPWELRALLALVITIPAGVNCFGVRSGSNLSNVMTIAKLSPLALLIVFGVAHFAKQPQMIHASDIASPGLSNWVSALVLLVFAYGGWEDGLLPGGEVREPRRTIPFALGAGLLTCAVIYMLLQFITVATIGGKITNAPLQETALVLLGRGGATFVTIAILISTYGWISGAMLYGPRLAYSLAAQGDFPAVFARLHARFHTPWAAILLFAFTGWVLASSGTFLWLVALSSGSMIVEYAGLCASLIRLRKLRPNADAFRIPFGQVFSIVGVAIAITLLTGLKRRELFLMCVTALIASANWLWARRHYLEFQTKAKTAAGSLSPP